MAETEECAHLACFLIAEVTVIHSVVIRATASTATDNCLSRGIAGMASWYCPLTWSVCVSILIVLLETPSSL